MSNYLRLDLNPRMVEALIIHQLDANAVASGSNPYEINRLHAIPLTNDAYDGWESRQE